jgi:DNA-directed RNA polymerase subunit B
VSAARRDSQTPLLPLPVLKVEDAGGYIPSEDRWTLVESFVRSYGLVRHQLDSFNDFVDRKLKEIIQEFNIDLGDIKVRFTDVEVGKPRFKEPTGVENVIYPMEARLRNITYAAPMRLKVMLYINGEEYTETVPLGDLPIMVRSKYCNLYGLRPQAMMKKLEDPNDPGGYFIINGSERVVVSQEDLALNKPIYDFDERGATKIPRAKIISMGPGYRTTVTIEYHKDGVIYVQIPKIPTRMPFPVVMRALGLEKDQDIALAVSDNEEVQRELLASFEMAIQVAPTVDEARDYIGRRIVLGHPRDVRIQRALEYLDKYFLPHLGTSPDDKVRLSKAIELGQAVAGVIELYKGWRQPDDKDHMSNKRVRLVGDLLAQLFRSIFAQFVQDLRNQLEKQYSRGKIPELRTIVRADIISDRLKHALSTGNWVGGKTGVTQMLDRTNYLSTISHLRRVVSSLSRTQPHFEARDLHPTQWGRLCAIETPEGQNCGLVKNLALMATVTVGVDESSVEAMLREMGVIDVLEARRNGIKGANVLLNGRLIGVHRDPQALVAAIREARRRGDISNEINVGYIEKLNEVRVNCDGGRLRRPLLIISNGKLRLTKEHIEKLRRGEWTWDDLVKNGIVEYLDADEEENALVTIGDTKDIDLSRYTHMEIIPSIMLGAAAHIIPYSEHNQSPRNIYEAAMAKQSLGFPYANYRYRIDSRGHLLLYPERPLVTTRGLELIGYSARPSGQNAILALVSFMGYSIEDAVMINKAAIERGMFRSIFYRSYETEAMRYPMGESDKITIPPPTVRDYRGAEAYAHLDEDGIVPPEVFVSSKEVLIGKISPPRFYSALAESQLAGEWKDNSITVRRGEKGIVDQVLITESSEGFRLIKVKVRELRIPELGDKFASRHGQKGVVGMIVPMEDMPFTENGVTPDIIINPHALPSRMTIGQLLEAIAGKAAALYGTLIDATPFEGVPERVIREMLMRAGYRWSGRETMYSGMLGTKLEADIFIGVVYYQKLHHMVADKIHARATGPMQILTRQPTEGRSREGGLRLGEMERDVLIAHGAAALLRERLVESSDKYVMYVCEDCGMMAWWDDFKKRPVCPIHGDKGRIAKVIVPYAFKLLLQELISLGIYPRLKLSEPVG